MSFDDHERPLLAYPARLRRRYGAELIGTLVEMPGPTGCTPLPMSALHLDQLWIWGFVLAAVAAIVARPCTCRKIRPCWSEGSGRRGDLGSSGVGVPMALAVGYYAMTSTGRIKAVSNAHRPGTCLHRRSRTVPPSGSDVDAC